MYGSINVAQHEARKHAIKCIDQSISTLSDGSIIRRSSQDILWQQLPPGSSPEISEIVKAYAPHGLESQFEALYRILRAAVVGGKNGSAFLQGSTGTGKSLVLDQCLLALRDECDHNGMTMFRIISLDGLCLPGTSGLYRVFQEVLRQLSQTSSTENAACNQEKINDLMNFKPSSFTNLLQLFKEAIMIGSLDQVPLVFVLNEIDSFLGTGSQQMGNTSSISLAEGISENSRQMLLYQVLDQVSAPESTISFVGITLDHMIMHRFEKRIRSRAEGTSSFINFGGIVSAEVVGHILHEKLSGPVLVKYGELFSHSNCVGDDKTDNQELRLVSSLLCRSLQLHSDLRQVFRVLTSCLNLDRFELENLENTSDMSSVASYSNLLESLLDHGSCADGAGPKDLNSRILTGLSGPELAIAFATRRLYRRFIQCGSESYTLTLQSIAEEYEKTWRGVGGKYSRLMLDRGFMNLLLLGLFTPIQRPYSFALLSRKDSGSNGRGFASSVIYNLKVNVSFDVGKLETLMESDQLRYSTALKEWGAKKV